MLQHWVSRVSVSTTERCSHHSLCSAQHEEKSHTPAKLRERRTAPTVFTFNRITSHIVFNEVGDLLSALSDRSIDWGTSKPQLMWAQHQKASTVVAPGLHCGCALCTLNFTPKHGTRFSATSEKKRRLCACGVVQYWLHKSR